jgi:hypothetical protein
MSGDLQTGVCDEQVWVWGRGGGVTSACALLEQRGQRWLMHGWDLQTGV